MGTRTCVLNPLATNAMRSWYSQSNRARPFDLPGASMLFVHISVLGDVNGDMPDAAADGQSAQHSARVVADVNCLDFLRSRLARPLVLFSLPALLTLFTGPLALAFPLVIILILRTPSDASQSHPFPPAG